MLLELTEHTGKLLPELAKNRIVGHYRHSWMRMNHADRGLDRIRHDRAQRMRSASFVADDVPDDSAFVLLGKYAEPFPHRAECVLRAIGCLEPERYGLRAASCPERLEPAVESSEVENRHLDRRRPLVAVVLAEKDLVEMSGLVDLTGNDDHAVSSDDSR